MTLPESYHSNDPTSSIPATMQSTYSHSSTASLSMITQSQGELTRSLEMLRSDRDAMRKRIEELEEKLKVYESANSGSVLSVPATMLASPGFTGASAPSTSRVRVTPTMRSLLPASRLAGGSGIGPGRSSSNSRALIGSTGEMSPSPKLTGYTAATLSSSRSTRDPVPSGLYQRSPTRSPVPRMAITPRSVIMNRSERSHSAMSTHSIGGGSQHSVSRTSSTSRAWKPSGLNTNPLNGACTPSRVLQERLAQRKRTAELRGRSVQSKAQVQDYSGRSRSANSGLIVLPGGGRNYRDGNIATRRVVRGPEPQLQGSGINVVTSSIASGSTSRLHTGRRLLHPPASKPSGDLGSQEFPKPKGTGQYAATQQTAATMRSVLWRVGSSSAIKKV